MLGFGLKLLTQLVKVKLLLSESKSLTISLENAEMIGVSVAWRAVLSADT